MSRDQYLSKLRLNLKLWPIRTFIQSLLFFIPIWYAFESQFASPGTLNLIYAMTTFITVSLELPTGALADLFGRKNSTLIGLFIQGASWIFIANSQNSTWLWIGYFVNSIAVSLISGADEALIFDTLKDLGQEKDFTKLSSKNSLIFRVGMIIATLSGGLIYGLNQKLPYILVGVVTIISALITFFFTEPITDSEKFTVSNYLRQTKIGFKQLFKTREQALFSAYYVVIGGITFYYQYFLYLAFITSLGFNTDQISYILSAFYLVNGSLIYFISKYRNQIPKSYIIIAFPIITALGFLPGIFAGKFLGPIMVFLIMIANMARYNFLNHYANDEYDSKYRATAISALNMFTSLVFVAISLLVSRVIDTLGVAIIMSALGVLVVVSMLFISTLYLNRHKLNLSKYIALQH